MSSLREATPHSTVIRPEAFTAHEVRPARLSSDLMTSPFAGQPVADARLVDPHLAEVVERAENAARARGFKAGYAAGMVAGREEALALEAVEVAERRRREEAERAQRVAELNRLSARVTSEVERVLQIQEISYDALREQIADMVVDLAESLVGHHLRVEDCGARDAMLRALREVPDDSAVILRINPADVQEITSAVEQFSQLRAIRIFADEDIEPAGCVAVTENLEVDARLTRALMRVRKVLES